MFLLKKMIAPLFFPLPFCFLLIGVGLGLLWFSRRQRAGKVVVTSGFLLLVIVSYGTLTGPLLQSLEYSTRAPEPAALAQAKWIVVLGGGSSPDPALPVTSRANGTTLARLVEGIRLQRDIPGARLLLSGAAVLNSGSDAHAMRAIAVALGVPEASIVLEDRSPDTETQAINVGRIVGDEPFVIVTSAYHMPRAARLFNKAGLRPLAAPAHYLSGRGAASFIPTDIYPTTGGLVTTQIVENEYLGTAWAMLRGKI